MSASASFAQLQAQMKEGVQALQELQAGERRRDPPSWRLVAARPPRAHRRPARRPAPRADVERIQRSRQQAVQQQHENEMVLKVRRPQSAPSAAAAVSPAAHCLWHAPSSLLCPTLPHAPQRVQELEVLDEDARVFKLIGPALVRQEQPEAAANVRKRLDFIAAEVSRLAARAAALEEKAGKRQAALQQIQAEAQRLQAQQQQQQGGGGGGA
jgi:chaperonin cofactor prefoldin